MTAKSLMLELADKAGIYPDSMRPSDGWLREHGLQYWGTPGKLYARLPEEEKEILRDLKSADIANVRVCPWWR